MKNRILTLMLASTLVSAPALAIVEPFNGVIYSTGNTLVISANSLANYSSFTLGSISSSIGFFSSFSIYNAGTPKTITLSAFGYRIVHTQQPYYWSSNQTLAKMVTSSQTFDPKGLLIREHTTEQFFNAQGRPAADLYLRISDSVYQYNSKSQRIGLTISRVSYDGKNRMVQRMTENFTYAYTSDGSMARMERNYRTTGADGKVINDASGRVVDTYTYDALDTIKVHDYYSIAGRLLGKTADLVVVQNGLSKKYGVSYDLNAAGAVTYTHVYEQKDDAFYIHQDIPELSGAGYKTATQVHAGIKNLAAQVAHLNVQGDMIFNSTKISDLSKFNINVSGSFTIEPASNGYDIYVTGDLSLTKGTLDIKGLKVYISGNLTVSADATLQMDSTSSVVMGGNMNIGSPAPSVVGGDLWVMERNAVIQVKQSSSLPQNVQSSQTLSGSGTFDNTAAIGSVKINS